MSDAEATDGYTEMEVELDDEHIVFLESIVAKEHAAGNTNATLSSVLVEILVEYLRENGLESKVHVEEILPEE